ncbi:hypothetical protein OF83DRAFT_1080938 [Amylostereum chailletii]|nr:hypothetical protein OF83DRAFT_1080938 [Amylostereum chailletii]
MDDIIIDSDDGTEIDVTNPRLDTASSSVCTTTDESVSLGPGTNTEATDGDSDSVEERNTQQTSQESSTSNANGLFDGIVYDEDIADMREEPAGAQALPVLCPESPSTAADEPNRSDPSLSAVPTNGPHNDSTGHEEPAANTAAASSRGPRSKPPRIYEHGNRKTAK